jgi:hypothetical protein
MDPLRILERLREFEAEAHQIFVPHESSRSRVVILSETYAELGGLSLDQDELFRQALRCIENELYRAAHVMAWAAFVDLYEGRLTSDGMAAVAAARPKWPTGTLEDLRESVTEYQLIEAGRAVHLLSKNEVKALHGLLNKRNECAHPSEFFPGLNESLGYVAELFRRVPRLQVASPRFP